MLFNSILNVLSSTSSVSLVKQRLMGGLSSLSYLQKSCKSKLHRKKWPQKYKKRLYTDIALQHFDTFYKPVYGKLWPSIRVSLLTDSKYCALLNNFHPHSDKVEDSLIALGAQNGMDVIMNAYDMLGEKSSEQSDEKYSENREHTKAESYTESEVNPEDAPLCLSEREFVDSDDKDDIQGDPSGSQQEIEQIREKNTSLYDFMPAEEVFTEKEMLAKQELEVSTYRGNSSDIPVSFVKDEEFSPPKYLKFYAYRKGKVRDFPSPTSPDGRQLGYYMMDAASLLPVIALDIKERDNVLDLCAAPGGKTLAMLQTNHIGNLHCNDNSESRLNRLKKILKLYMGTSQLSYVTITKSDGVFFKDTMYDKVLVDVPCNTDRHSALDEENNLFKPGRLSERLKMTTVQKDLLVSGIKACAPGGSVVYSTCTLSPAQNDGVVQAAMEHMWKETNINVAVVELDFIPKICGKIFSFYNGCRYGQLALPTLSCNFGPMYVAKVKRLD